MAFEIINEADADDAGAHNFSDPYWQWSNGWGKSFDPFERIKESPQQAGDFSFFLESSLPAASDPVIEPFSQRTVFTASNADIPNDTDAAMLPIPASAFDGTPVSEAERRAKMREIFRAQITELGLEIENLSVTAVIDDGINICNDRFSCPAGNPHSRVDFAWAQGGAQARSVPGMSMGFGAIQTGAAIDGAVSDEVGALRDLGFSELDSYQGLWSEHHATHGTHILDLAAGFEPGDNEATRRIIAVQLPRLVTADTSGKSLEFCVGAGLSFIFEAVIAMSLEVGHPIPLAINFSYGLGAGPHDGTGRVERLFREYYDAYKLDVAEKFPSATGDPLAEFILPSGNRRLAQGHARSARAEAGQATELELPLRLQPDDHSSNFIEIWLHKDATVSSAEITNPNGSMVVVNIATPKLLLGNGAAGMSQARRVIGRVSHDPAVPPSNYQRVLVAMAPTAFSPPSTSGNRAVCESGIWKIKITATDLPVGERIDAWIQRDDAPFGIKVNGRQAYFDTPVYESSRFDPVNGDLAINDAGVDTITRLGTLSGIASRPLPAVPTAAEDHIAVIGSYNETNGVDSFFSGIGDGGRVADPDAPAPAQRSRVLTGVLASGVRSGSAVQLTGTSAAAPQATRSLVNSWHGGGSSNVTTHIVSVATAGKLTRNTGRNIHR